MVLNGRGDDVLANARELLGERYPFHRGVDRLSAAAGEDHLVRATSEQPRYGLPGVIDSTFRFARQLVCGGRVAELLFQVWQHRLSHLRVERCRGGVI